MTTKISSDNIQSETLSTLSAPKVSTIGYPGDDTSADTAGGQTITLTGSGFNIGASVIINNQSVAIVSVVSATQITFVSPALSAGSYTLYVINSDGSTAIAVPGIQYSGVPNWVTGSGSLGTQYEYSIFTSTLTATGDAPITYGVHSGLLPSGITLNSSTGVISGTLPVMANSTTYTFTIRATDNEQQDTDRQFSITINPDVVTWSSPANNSTVLGEPNVLLTQELSATSAAGYSITYTANALPTGLSISGANITGTPTASGNTTSLITATAATTSRLSNITLNFSIVLPVMAATGGTITTSGDYKIHTFTSSGTFQITSAPSGTTFETLIVAGGGAGSYAYAGGGGAGGVLYGTLNSAVGSYTITVGQGGTWNGATATTTSGANSVMQFGATTYTAVGGGAGGGWWAEGQPGGSGGGAGGVAGVGSSSGGASTQTSQSPLTGYGNAGGGASRSSGQPGGGGGGAGAAGVYGGSGGAGIANPIVGSTIGQLDNGVYYIGGGGGGTFGLGGLGGGGRGGNAPTKQNGTPNTGGGGGGGYNNDGGTDGGSGVVIFRYKYQ